MRQVESEFLNAEEEELREQSCDTVQEYEESMQVWEEMKDTGDLSTSDTDLGVLDPGIDPDKDPGSRGAGETAWRQGCRQGGSERSRRPEAEWKASGGPLLALPSREEVRELHGRRLASGGQGGWLGRGCRGGRRRWPVWDRGTWGGK
jgi:hypothetical protein